MAGGGPLALPGRPRPGPGQQQQGQPAPGPGDSIDFKAEQAALRAFGVQLADDHLGGYVYKPDRFKPEAKENVKPWEVGVVQQVENTLGPLPVHISAAPESWKNEEVLFEVREGIAYVTLNRPAANNALNDTVSAGLEDAIRILKGRPDIRVAVLTGNGKMFCAGGDPKSFQAAQASAGVIEKSEGQEAQVPQVPAPSQITLGPKLAETYSKKGQDAMAVALARPFFEWAMLPQFTIALLNGSAMGGGVGLVCACDMAVAVKTAHVTLSEVRLGVIPAVISPHVIRTIGAANAKKLFVTGENCSAQQAKAYGMIQRVVDNVSDFPAVVKEVAQRIQACAPGALAMTKRCALNCLNQPFSESLIRYTAEEYAKARKGEEGEEGMKAVAAKSRPSWASRAIDARDS